ncbi:hypothetical protein SAY87_004510 [Trapa incisa]|uniref:NAB domain-containing protein n=1 Tax=Trapa incisa TaxID=236973 RepID=A0AAN7JTC5_9MYRT|nr:hypothetical protein SAY87_004510 [Trapa incisa]
MSDQSPSSSLTGSRRSRSPFTTRPSWLLCTIADFDEKMKAIETANCGKECTGHTFAQRAESYYIERPQLLSLLQNLYNGYLALSNLYINALAKPDRENCIELESPDLQDHDEVENSEVHSSLSYQKSPMSEEVGMAELEMENVENDSRMEESYKKIQLQENLLEVLESERMILVRQNADLELQVAALVEQNQVLLGEKELLKYRASELAKCVWKTKGEGCVKELRSKRVVELEKKEMQLGNEDGEDGKGISEGSVGCFDKLKPGSRWKAEVKKLNIFNGRH